MEFILGLLFLPSVVVALGCLNSWKSLFFLIFRKKLVVPWVYEEFGYSPQLGIILVISCVVCLICGIDEVQNYIPEGRYCYIVEVSNGENTYYLPAEIDVDSDAEEREHLSATGERETSFINHRSFSILYAYWPNGGYLNFESSDDPSIYFDESTSLSDQDGNYWEVKLTHERSSHPEIQEFQETNIEYYIGTYGIFFLAATLALTLFLWFAHRKESRASKTV